MLMVCEERQLCVGGVWWVSALCCNLLEYGECQLCVGGV